MRVTPVTSTSVAKPASNSELVVSVIVPRLESRDSGGIDDLRCPDFDQESSVDDIPASVPKWFHTARGSVLDDSSKEFLGNFDLQTDGPDASEETGLERDVDLFAGSDVVLGHRPAGNLHLRGDENLASLEAGADVTMPDF